MLAVIASDAEINGVSAARAAQYTSPHARPISAPTTGIQGIARAVSRPPRVRSRVSSDSASKKPFTS